MFQTVRDFFNWRKYPGTVFDLVIPLAAMGFISTLAVAILHIRLQHDYVYLGIWIAGMILLVVAITPPLRALRRMGVI